ncbi:uncharacterized protein LOC130816006 [Amaranthus tricolor]|uniref:uncharacterized protein LOC130816006 n=1 Tax=Amaranthus tricolor TaxID=29722 RepID=UPI00258AC37E|nr:uncharacterized protein LOC130816006 [Amaranthus tricolor]
MSTSLKEYLKKYETNAPEEKKKKRKKTKAVASGVLVVDEDPVWQKPINLEKEDANDSPDEKPQVDEDIEVKRMKRLEMLRARRSNNEISEDGSGWISISEAPKCSASIDPSSDISPPRNHKARYDTPSPEAGLNGSDSGREATDLSPPRLHRQRNDSPSPGPNGAGSEGSDLSPPRQCHKSNNSPSFERKLETLDVSKESDLSPPRQRRRRYDSPSPQRMTKASDADQDSDMSPPRRRGQSHGSHPPTSQRNPSVHDIRNSNLDNLSLQHPGFPNLNDSQSLEDLSPARKRQKGIDKRRLGENSAQEMSTKVDLSPPRKRKEQPKRGLITGKDVGEEIAKSKKDEWFRFNEMDPSTSGRGVEPVYRFKGKRVSKSEYLKLTKKAEKPKEEEKKLEWGKGLAQKREAEARLLELELEKEKPFARSKDDPELDRMMKDRLRWGDPMAHLVKKKQPDLLLSDLGENEKMKESGFIIPQDIPSHSWIKRGLDYEPNRYGIKPGRHWDGVDRSNGYEKQLFKRMNEKRATEREAYLWSVSDM